MGMRRKGRELALQALYLSDVTSTPIEKAIKTILIGATKEKPTEDFAKKIALGTAAHLESINKLIAEAARNWEMSRMAALDRNILRMGAYELIFETDTPVSVIIDEAVDIAKEFSTPDSGKFVNGILDKIKQERSHGKKS